MFVNTLPLQITLCLTFCYPFYKFRNPNTTTFHLFDLDQSLLLAQRWTALCCIPQQCWLTHILEVSCGMVKSRRNICKRWEIEYLCTLICVSIHFIWDEIECDFIQIILQSTFILLVKYWAHVQKSKEWKVLLKLTKTKRARVPCWQIMVSGVVEVMVYLSKKIYLTCNIS